MVAVTPQGNYILNKKREHFFLKKSLPNCHSTTQDQRASSKQETLSASVAQLDTPSDWRQGGRGFEPGRGRQHSFVDIDHEISSTVILSPPLIQEGQLSVSGEIMCIIGLLVNRLED